MLDLKFKCHWHDFICKEQMMCEECPHCPKVEELPNYHKPRLKAELDPYGMPICPTCGCETYDYRRCIFCGQEIKAKRMPMPLIVGWREYRLAQMRGTSYNIFVFKDGKEVMHALCTKPMTPKEARQFLKRIPKCFKALSEVD